MLEDLATPPITHIGALEIDAFLPKRARRELAAALNTLLASPTFASWRQGTTLDIGAWLTPTCGRTPATIVSVAHLDDALERLSDTLRKLGKRWFVVRDAHSAEGTVLMQPRWAMSFMKGPMTRSEIRAALGVERIVTNGVPTSTGGGVMST